MFHSHPETAPRPSRTDLENVGLWAGKPYVIYSLARDELAAWTIGDGAAQPLSVRDEVSDRGPGPRP